MSKVSNNNQDSLKADNHNRTFCQNVTSKFNLKNQGNHSFKKAKILNTGKKAEIFRVLLLIPLRLSMKVLKKSKFFKNKCKNPTNKSNNKDN